MTKQNPPVTEAQPSVRFLSIARCWQLLATAGVGRIAVCRDGDAPIVVPVNYRVEDRTILFRTGEGTKLDLLRERPISFQIDAADPVHRVGWSVLVRGVAAIEDPRADDETQPIPWIGTSRRHRLVRIWPTSVTGRQIEAAEHVWDSRGYL